MAALATRFQLGFESYEGWSHLWINNPAYREISGKFPLGWVLENPDGAIAGYLGNIPLNYEFEGRKLLAATTRAWVVDTPYRTYSTLLLGTYFKQRNVDLFMNTSINSQAAPAYATFQGIPAPVGDWDRTLFWITNRQGFTKSLLRKKGWAMPRPLTYVLSAGVFLYDQLRSGRFREKANKVPVLSCAGFDDRFDAFWAALRRTKSNMLLAVRSQEVLDWHFKFALQQNDAWIYAVEGDSGLAAYAVFVRQVRPEAQLVRVDLADFQCLEQEKAPALLSAMLQVAINRCRQESIHMLELIGLGPHLEKEVERASPHRRKLRNWMYCYKASDPMLSEKLKSAAVWEPSPFDGDSSL